MEYRVRYEGFVIVEADSPEEAEEKYALDDILYGESLITHVREVESQTDCNMLMDL